MDVGSWYSELVSWIFWVIASITLHELAHGWAAIWEGDDTPRVTGHMTANPVVHMGVPSIDRFFNPWNCVGHDASNPYRFRHGKWGRIFVVVCRTSDEPCSLIRFTFWGVYTTNLAFHIEEPTTEQTQSIETFLLNWRVFESHVLFALNMLPVPPLDGSNILGESLKDMLHGWYSHPASSNRWVIPLFRPYLVKYVQRAVFRMGATLLTRYANYAAHHLVTPLISQLALLS